MRRAERDRRRGRDMGSRVLLSSILSIGLKIRPGKMAAETNRAVSITSGWTLGRANKSQSASISADLRLSCRKGQIADGIEVGHVVRAERTLLSKRRVNPNGLIGDRWAGKNIRTT